MYSVKSVDRLIGELSKLPGIGEKTAQRLCFYILRMPKEGAINLTKAIRELKEKVRYCSICNNITEEDPCQICRDKSRDRSIICVVEEPQDVFLIEKLGEYKGVYHVLGGAISPIKGVEAEDIAISSLLERVKREKVKEVILATDPDVEGETTAIYIFKILSPLSVKVTRLAHGLPAGGDLEFADEVTLSQALRGRQEMSSAP
ncbi:recombination protein RecR [Candidatus Aerophobetes bacterium]|uniref:Recombination protein RecR n=1 Tax=Aerophobetes bacterium TaxID=2030807 RepID=A0A497E2R9_UNCAE|nr:recombination protein RecR [Candidatus Aerophobetes bacterium]RLE07799.1 MAG: recombination protein RecR [Candidatus Aerophobetes bacterium]